MVSASQTLLTSGFRVEVDLSKTWSNAHILQLARAGECVGDRSPNEQRVKVFGRQIGGARLVVKSSI